MQIGENKSNICIDNGQMNGDPLPGIAKMAYVITQVTLLFIRKEVILYSQTKML